MLRKKAHKLDQYCVLLRLLYPVLVSLKCDDLRLSKLPLAAEVKQEQIWRSLMKQLFLGLILIYDILTIYTIKPTQSQNGGIQMHSFLIFFFL